MTIEEFKTELTSIEQEAEKKKRSLIWKFALDNAKYKVGTIVEDSIGKIQITKISASYFFGEPETVYDGIVLKKDGTPSKKNETRNVWQKNIKCHNS